ncbi:hypothetical protein [Pandoraea sp. SD6-2]|uniref:hypothetical protein n=1 Tax=Pandoraea sp. SD6-2 TaxID=1286093 RepID=UPI00032F7989|nr:hypothetical protein [Pandoraea sp. SD6-2]EON13812.1 hypothetical protein C266_10254 [Pandoraea sp. SD6-2]
MWCDIAVGLYGTFSSERGFGSLHFDETLKYKGGAQGRHHASDQTTGALRKTRCGGQVRLDLAIVSRATCIVA